MLTPSDILRYLIQRGRLTSESLFAGDVQVIDVSRRNHNFKIVSRDGAFLIKHGVNAETASSLSCEAAVYELLHSDTESRRTRMADHVPAYYGYDAANHVLILGLIIDAEDVRTYQDRRRNVSTRIAASMGGILGTFHSLRCLESKALGTSSFRNEPPWVLSLHRPRFNVFRELSSANLRIVRVIQECDEFSNSFDTLSRAWVPDRLIHSDVKWDNWVVLPRSSSQRTLRLSLIDWELASIGDPAWDVGSVLAGYLSLWLSSIPILEEGPSERLLALARYPLERIQSAVRAFWMSYVRRVDLFGLNAEQCLLKAIRYAAARLVQTEFEQSRTASRVTANTICALQLSLNMMLRPMDSALLLLGLR